MSGSLWDGIDEGRRRRLRGRGWEPDGATLRGVRLWRRPEDGALVEEQDAFRWLEAAEINEQDREE